MTRYTPFVKAPVPESENEFTLTSDLWATAAAFDSEISQTRGESSLALTRATRALGLIGEGQVREELFVAQGTPPEDTRVLWIDTSTVDDGGGVDPDPEPDPEPDYGYVDQIAAASPYSTLSLHAADDTGDVVSLDLISDGARQRTVRVQGEYVEGTGYIDGYQRIEEITGNDGTTLLGPRSNLEWAYQYFATPSATSGAQFSPYHGSTTALAWQTAPPTYRTLSGQALTLPSQGSTIPLPDGLTLTQTVRAQHPAAPDEDQIEVTTTTSFYPDGLIAVEGTARFLVDVKVSAVYAPMVSFTQADIHTLTHEGGVVTVPTTAPSGITNLTLPDIDGGLLEGDGIQIAWHWVSPDETLRRAEPDQKTTGDITFVQRRPDGIDKVYRHVWNPGTVVTAGTTYNFAAQWRYQEVA